MYLLLAKKNLLGKKSRTILTTAGIAIGVASLVAMLSFSAGLKQAIIETIIQQGPVTQITVTSTAAQSGLLKFIPENTKEIDDQVIEEIKKIPNVSQVHPQLTYNNFASLKIDYFKRSFQTDAMLFGASSKFLGEDLAANNISTDEWENPQEPYPAFISRRIIDLYNFTVAPTGNLPLFTEKDLNGIEFEVLPGQSTFFPYANDNITPIKAKVVGFSEKVEFIGITLPDRLIEKLNGSSKNSYAKIYVYADSVMNVEPISNQLESMGLKAHSIKQEIQLLEQNFKVLNIGLGLISFIILLISGLTIANTFINSVNERKHEIGLFRTLGATKKDIRNIFLVEASLIGFLAGLTGLLFGVIGGIIADKVALSMIPEVASRPETLFLFTPGILLLSLSFSVVLSLIFAFIPSSIAAKLDPLVALTE